MKFVLPLRQSAVTARSSSVTVWCVIAASLSINSVKANYIYGWYLKKRLAKLASQLFVHYDGHHVSGTGFMAVNIYI